MLGFGNNKDSFPCPLLLHPPEWLSCYRCSVQQGLNHFVKTGQKALDLGHPDAVSRLFSADPSWFCQVQQVTGVGRWQIQPGSEEMLLQASRRLLTELAAPGMRVGEHSQVLPGGNAKS